MRRILYETECKNDFRKIVFSFHVQIQGKKTHVIKIKGNF